MPPTALITGASVGIGYELAREFARGGYDLILVAHDREKLQAVAAEIESLGTTSAEVHVADLSDPAAPAALVAALDGRPVDALVNNAGFGAVGPFAATDLARQLDMIRVNVTALVDLTHRLLPQMIARGSGGVLNVASTAAFLPGPFMAIYYATKAFVLSFSEALAEELAPAGVRVTALCPGPTESEFRRRAKMESSPVFKTSALPVATAQSVARAGFKAFAKGRRLATPGTVNKLGVQALRFLPRRLATLIAAKINRSK